MTARAGACVPAHARAQALARVPASARTPARARVPSHTRAVRAKPAGARTDHPAAPLPAGPRRSRPPTPQA